MKIVLCPDKFKGSATAFEIADAMGNGILSILPTCTIQKCPLADGGEGSLEILREHYNLIQKNVIVDDPIGRDISSHYMTDGSTAFIEMSKASGIQLLQLSEFDALNSSSYGTGQLIKDAAISGVNKIYLFIGGSATTDAGVGMASALGYRFLDKENKEVFPNGANLAAMRFIDRSNAIKEIHEIEFVTICDVDNPLHGNDGAAYVYAAQKGASQAEIELLDFGLRNIGAVISNSFDIDINNLKGAGAAGGLGAGSVAFLKAKLKSGIESMMELTHFYKYAHDADLLITGEGRLDSQSLQGKVISGVMTFADTYDISWSCICGFNALDTNQSSKMSADYIQDLLSLAGSANLAMSKVLYYTEEATKSIIKKYLNL